MAASLILFTFLLSACGGASVCDEPRRYESSQPGKRIEPPDGLDALNPARELSIPEPSPQPPGAFEGSCLEVPPTYRSTEN